MKVYEIEYFETGHVPLMCMMHGKLVKIFLLHNEAIMDWFYQGAWIYLNSFLFYKCYLLTLRSLGSIHYLDETFADIAMIRRNWTTYQIWADSAWNLAQFRLLKQLTAQAAAV